MVSVITSLERPALVIRRTGAVLVFLILTVVSAEALIAFVDLYFGLAVHAAMLLASLTIYSLKANSRPTDQASYDPFCEALPAVCLIPLLRILSATMPIKGLEPVYWIALTGGPLLLGLFLVARRLGVSRSTLGLSLGYWPAQALIGVSGACLGLVGFAVLSPEPPSMDGWQQILTVSLVLVVFSACTEEAVFRGLIQGLLQKAAPAYSVVGSSILFSATYLGAERISYVPFITAAGIYFGWGARRTKSVMGVSVAHALMKLGMFVLWPMVLG